MTPRLRLAAASRTIRPFRQGELDGLSGLYMLINAARLVLHPRRAISRQAAVHLFNAALAALHRHDSLFHCVAYGVNETGWHLIVDAVAKEVSARYSAKLELVAPPSPAGAAPRHVYRHVRRSIRAGWPVAVQLAGPPPRWTLVVRATASRFYLFDSGHRRWLPARRSAGVADHRSAHHSIAQLFAVQLIYPPPPARSGDPVVEASDG